MLIYWGMYVVAWLKCVSCIVDIQINIPFHFCTDMDYFNSEKNVFRLTLKLIYVLMWFYVTSFQILVICVSEWVIVCCLKANEQLFSNIMPRTSCIRWDDDICTRSTFLVRFYSASSLKQCPWIDLLTRTLSWFWANQSLLLLLSAACLTEKQ